MKFQEFWTSLIPQRRAVLVTIYQTGLSARTGGFYKSTVSTTVPLIDKICLTEVFQKEYDPEDEVNHFGDYLGGVFRESARFEGSTSDKFEQVCLLLREHCTIATMGF